MLFYDPSGAMPLEPLSIVEIALLADLYAGDFDGNQVVGAGDLVQWRNDFGGTGSDADGDGDTDGADFLIWQRQLGGGLAVVASSDRSARTGRVDASSCAIHGLPCRPPTKIAAVFHFDGKSGYTHRRRQISTAHAGLAGRSCQRFPGDRGVILCQ